jgi:hypothetical protein
MREISIVNNIQKKGGKQFQDRNNSKLLPLSLSRWMMWMDVFRVHPLGPPTCRAMRAETNRRVGRISQRRPAISHSRTHKVGKILSLVHLFYPMDICISRLFVRLNYLIITIGLGGTRRQQVHAK